jgi:hypothetical protein
VVQASAQKQADLGGPVQPAAPPVNYRNAAIMRETGAGLATASPVERDLATLSWPDLDQKYGQAKSDELFAGLNTARNQFDRDSTAQRTNGEAVADAFSGTGMGVLNSFYGLAATGAGLVNADAGQGLSKALSALDEEMQGKESYGLRTKRAADQDVSALEQRDSDAQFEQDKASSGSFVAGLNRIGRDFMSTAKRTVSDGTLLSDNIAGGLGSVISAAPLMGFGGLAADGIGAAVKAVAPKAAGAASDLIGSAVSKLPSSIQPTTSGVAGQAGLGAQIAGTAYQDTSETARAKLEDRTDLTEDQKTAIANRAGLTAAAVAAPIAVLGGIGINAVSHGAEKLVGAAEKGLYGFEANPFEAHSLKGVAGHMLEESAQEALRSTSDQLGQNIAIQQQVDPEQTLSQGVGGAMASGAIGGLGGAGVTQSPVAARLVLGAAGRTAGRTTMAAIGAIGSSAAAKADAVRAQNDAQSPIADPIVQAKADAVTETAPQALEVAKTEINDIPDEQASPEQKDEASSYMDKLIGAFTHDDQATQDDPTIPASVKDTIAGSTNAFSVMSKLANVIKSGDINDPATIDAAIHLTKVQNQLTSLITSDPEALQSLSPDSPVTKMVQGYGQTLTDMGNTPAIMAALDKADTVITQRAKDFAAQPITDETLATPEGEQGVRATIQLAHKSLDGGNLDAIQAILKAADRGTIQLSDDQKQTLQASATVIDAAQKAQDQRDALGLQTKVAKIGVQKETNPDADANKQNSTVYHTQQVLQAIQAGNDQLAAERLQRFGQYNQSQQNKVEAINTHFDNGGGDRVPYHSFNPRTGEGYVERENLQGITTTGDKIASSVDYANTVGVEANRIGSVYNNLTKTFPQLNAKEIPIQQINPALQGKPQQVAREFKAGERIRPELAARSDRTVVEPAGQPILSAEQAPVTVRMTAKSTPKTPEKVTKPVAPVVKEATAPAKTGAEVTLAPVKPVEKTEPRQETPAGPAPETKPALKGTEAVHPNLVGVNDGSSVKSRFPDTFKYPEEQKSRLAGALPGDESPLEAMKTATSSLSNLNRFMGKTITGSTERVNDFDTAGFGI